MENKLLFAPENSRVSAVLAPSKDNPRNSEGDFIRLKDGRILYAFSYYHGEDGGDHARCDIRCLWSDDEGESFHTGENDGGKPHLLISAEPYGEKNVMSASLLRMQNGDVGLFYILKHGDMTDEILLSRPNDECESFYETTQVLPGKWKGYYVLNNSRIEQLSDGRILCPDDAVFDKFIVPGTASCCFEVELLCICIDVNICDIDLRELIRNIRLLFYIECVEIKVLTSDNKVRRRIAEDMITICI
ncbi:MAG: glycoside hydrolase [Clostridia bacterium]|nr:glycoside hydrolase [Clostridia bacterium]